MKTILNQQYQNGLSSGLKLMNQRIKTKWSLSRLISFAAGLALSMSNFAYAQHETQSNPIEVTSKSSAKFEQQSPPDVYCRLTGGTLIERSFDELGFRFDAVRVIGGQLELLNESSYSQILQKSASPYVFSVTSPVTVTQAAEGLTVAWLEDDTYVSPVFAQTKGASYEATLVVLEDYAFEITCSDLK